MTMEAGAEAQQGADTAVAETEAQQITQAQIATLTQVTTSSASLLINQCHHVHLVCGWVGLCVCVLNEIFISVCR